LAVAMGLFTLPVMAQPPAAKAMTAPTGQPAAQPVVKPRNLMTAQEKQAYRRDMKQARTAQEKQQIQDKKYGQLRQRATERGVVMADPPVRQGNPALRPEARTEKPMVLRPMAGGAK
ncbi:MAG: hypothetical protein WCP34_07675, partial [Pseudomonadota bacterium]